MLNKDIAKFSYKCMSDSKWRKLFGVVNDSSLKMVQCTWKLVGEQQCRSGFVPDLEQLGDNYVGDCGALNGPFEFRRIEWLLLPHRVEFKPYKNAPTQYKTQVLTPILEHLNMLGSFEVEMDKVGLRIYGYKP